MLWKPGKEFRVKSANSTYRCSELEFIVEVKASYGGVVMRSLPIHLFSFPKSTMCSKTLSSSVFSSSHL